MSRLSIFISLLLFAGGVCFGQNINRNVNRNVNQNVQQNSVIINTQPVIEKKEYIIKYRTVYVDKPQPKRYARKLSAPLCLLNYLWVYPEDLGSYPSGPGEIISQINRQGMYGRNTWRVPTDDELRLMENYADKCGLGDDIYLSTTHRNGILRLVSTGLSVQEQKQAEKEAMEAERLRRQEEENRRAYEATQLALRQQREHQEVINSQNALVASGGAFDVNGLIWSSCNTGARNAYDKGVAYQTVSCPSGWRLPTEQEFRTLLRQSTKYDSYFKHPGGLIIPFGVYAIQGGGYIMLPNMMVSNGNTPKLVRTVKNKIY